MASSIQENVDSFDSVREVSVAGESTVKFLKAKPIAQS